jgi:hypothetical protein
MCRRCIQYIIWSFKESGVFSPEKVSCLIMNVQNFHLLKKNKRQKSGERGNQKQEFIKLVTHIIIEQMRSLLLL